MTFSLEKKKLHYFANLLILIFGFFRILLISRNFSCNLLTNNFNLSDVMHLWIFGQKNFYPAARRIKFETGGVATMGWFWRIQLAHVVCSSTYHSSNRLDCRTFQTSYMIYTLRISDIRYVYRTFVCYNYLIIEQPHFQ